MFIVSLQSISFFSQSLIANMLYNLSFEAQVRLDSEGEEEGHQGGQQVCQVQMLKYVLFDTQTSKKLTITRFFCWTCHADLYFGSLCKLVCKTVGWDLRLTSLMCYNVIWRCFCDGCYMRPLVIYAAMFESMEVVLKCYQFFIKFGRFVTFQNICNSSQFLFYVKIPFKRGYIAFIILYYV